MIIKWPFCDYSYYNEKFISIIRYNATRYKLKFGNIFTINCNSDKFVLMIHILQQFSFHVGNIEVDNDIDVRHFFFLNWQKKLNGQTKFGDIRKIKIFVSILCEYVLSRTIPTNNHFDDNRVSKIIQRIFVDGIFFGWLKCAYCTSSSY